MRDKSGDGRRISATGAVFAAAAVLSGLLGAAYHAVALCVLDDTAYSTVGVVSAWQSTLGVPLAAVVVAVAASRPGAPWRFAAWLSVPVAVVTLVVAWGAGPSTAGVCGVGLWLAVSVAGVPARGVLVATGRLGVVALWAVVAAVARLAALVVTARWSTSAAVLSSVAAEALATLVVLGACAKVRGRLEVPLSRSALAVGAQLGLWVAVALAAHVAATTYEGSTSAALVAGVSMLSGLVALTSTRAQAAVPQLVEAGAAARDCERSLARSTVAVAVSAAAGAALAWPLVDAVSDRVFPSPWWVLAPLVAGAAWAVAAVPLTTLVARRATSSFMAWTLVPAAAVVPVVVPAVAVWPALGGAGALAAAGLWHRSGPGRH